MQFPIYCWFKHNLFPEVHQPDTQIVTSYKLAKFSTRKKEVDKHITKYKNKTTEKKKTKRKQAGGRVLTEYL